MTLQEPGLPIAPGVPSGAVAAAEIVTPPVPDSATMRRLDWHRLAAPIAACVVGIVYFGLLTCGSFDPTHRIGLDAFFEEQARALLHGHLAVDRQVLSGEAIIVDGRA